MHLSKFIFNPFSVLYRTMRHHASPSRCSSKRCLTFALKCHTSPRLRFAWHCCAFALKCHTSPRLAFAALVNAAPRLGFTLLYIAFAIHRRRALLCLTFAMTCSTIPLLCLTLPSPCRASLYPSIAKQCTALPSPCSAIQCYSVAWQCGTWRRLRHAEQSLASPSPR